MSGSYTSWSLLGGWLSAIVAAVAWTTFLIGVAWRRRPIWHWLVIAAVAGITTVVLARFVINAPARFGSTYPRSFLAWGALPIFAAGAAVWEWNVVGWSRRALVLVSIPAVALFGA